MTPPTNSPQNVALSPYKRLTLLGEEEMLSIERDDENFKEISGVSDAYIKQLV